VRDVNPRSYRFLAGEALWSSAGAAPYPYLLRRVEEAAQYVPYEQLALSPQCGFASVAEGNLLSQDDQRRKLELVVETARKVWG